MIYFGTILGVIFGPNNKSVFVWVFGISSILAQASLINCHLDVCCALHVFIEQNWKIELWPTRQAQNVILDFRKKTTVALLPTPDVCFRDIDPLQN